MRRLLPLLALGCGADEPPATLGLCESCDRSCTEEYIAATTSEHVTGDVIYPDPPPTSGDHDPCWATWGVHTDAVPDERWVHNLEHGGVVYLYNCPDGCDAEVQQLTDLADAMGIQVLVTPYDALPTRFAAVAWEWRYVTDCFDVDAMEAFYHEHVDHGPESLPTDPGPECL